MFVGGSGSRQIFNKASVNTKVSKLGNDVKNRQVSFKPNYNEIKSEKNELNPLQQGEKKSTNTWNFFSLDLKNSFNFTKSSEALRDKHVQELTEKVKELENELKKTISEKDSALTGKDLEIVKLTGENKILKSDLEAIATIKAKYGSSPTTKTGQIYSGIVDAAKFGGQQVAGAAVTNLAYAVALVALAYCFGVASGKDAEEKAADIASGKVSDVDLEAHKEKLKSYRDVAANRIEKLDEELGKIEQLEVVMAAHPKDTDLQNKRTELHNVAKDVDKNINNLTEKFEKGLTECQNENINYNKSLAKNKDKSDTLKLEYEVAVKNEMKKLDLPKYKAAFSIITLMKKSLWADYNTFSKQLKLEDQKEIKKVFEELDKIVPTGKKNLEKSEKLTEQLQAKIEKVRPNYNQGDENKGILESIRSIIGF